LLPGARGGMFGRGKSQGDRCSWFEMSYPSGDVDQVIQIWRGSKKRVNVGATRMGAKGRYKKGSSVKG